MASLIFFVLALFWFSHAQQQFVTQSAFRNGTGCAGEALNFRALLQDTCVPVPAGAQVTPTWAIATCTTGGSPMAITTIYSDAACTIQIDQESVIQSDCIDNLATGLLEQTRCGVLPDVGQNFIRDEYSETDCDGTLLSRSATRLDTCTPFGASGTTISCDQACVCTLNVFADNDCMISQSSSLASPAAGAVCQDTQQFGCPFVQFSSPLDSGVAKSGATSLPLVVLALALLVLRF